MKTVGVSGISVLLQLECEATVMNGQKSEAELAQLITSPCAGENLPPH